MTKINDAISAIEDAATPARRRKVYRIVQAVLLVLVLRGLVTSDDATGYLQALALAVGLAPAELAARNVTD